MSRQAQAEKKAAQAKRQKEIEASQKQRELLKQQYGSSASFRENSQDNRKLQIDSGIDKKKLKGSTSEVTKPPFKAKKGKNEKFDNLRYPYSTIDETQDFIEFTTFTYKRNKNTKDGTGNATLVTRDESNLKADRLGSIILPIPAQLTDSNSANWKSGNMNFMQEQGIQAAQQGMSGNMKGVGETVNQIVSDFNATPVVKQFFATQALNSLGGNMSMESVMARSTGQVINPNMELLFSGPNLRQFSFQFKFTPRFEKEAHTVRTIMKTFKRNMAPKGAGGNMLKTPNIFEIQYIGKARHYLNRIKMCALQNVGINFTGDGTFVTYKDGSPISSTMTLQFQELTPIYNEDYDDYNSIEDGVGY